jgi:phage gp36-like protein
MSYATPEDIYAIYGEANVKQLLNNKADTSPLLRALKNASSEIDGYLNKRYRTPLVTVPALVNEWACIIAFYKMSTDYGKGLSEERRKRYDDIFKYLLNISAGKAVIPELEGEDGEIVAPEGKETIKLADSNNRRAISRRQMGAF